LKGLSGNAKKSAFAAFLGKTDRASGIQNKIRSRVAEMRQKPHANEQFGLQLIHRRRPVSQEAPAFKRYDST
jgi:hypothetical protein